MTENIQHIIDQIQKEGIDNATKAADTIIKDAQLEAEKILQESNEKYAAKISEAEQKATALTNRSIITIKQAARDLLILLGQSCEKVVATSLQQSVQKNLSSDLLKDLIKRVVSDESGSVELTVNESEIKELTEFCAELSANSDVKINLTSHSDILSGFTIGFKNKNVYLDYTGEAISSALSSFLRPELAKLVKDAVNEPITEE